MIRLAAPFAGPALAIVVLAGCGGQTGGLSDAAWSYCTTESSPEELAAAAQALNLQVEASAFAQGSLDRGDPVVAQACEYAFTAKGGNLDAPVGQPGLPGDTSPTAPLDPQSSLQPSG